MTEPDCLITAFFLRTILYSVVSRVRAESEPFLLKNRFYVDGRDVLKAFAAAPTVLLNFSLLKTGQLIRA